LDVCCKDPDFVPPPPPPKAKYAPRCGRRNQNGLGVRIQGFTDGESQFGEWPHMCAVLHEKTVTQEQSPYSGESVTESVNLYQCGGSLIAPGVILTAAHCVDRYRESTTELKVRCGEWNTQNETEPYPHQDRHVESLKIHSLFNSGSLANDFALLFTKEDFILASHIDTVCLPEVYEVFEGQTCFATGWGKDKFGSNGEYQVVLKEIDLPVVNHDVCEDKLRLTRLGKKFQLHESFLCAGGVDNKDTCKGDGGSPLVCPSKYQPDTYVQAGIVAWGVGCGEDNTPGVYASVSKALCWVDYLISCQQGGYTGQVPSYNGYTSDVCKPYMENLKTYLQQLPEKIYNRVGGKDLEQCSVHWIETTETTETIETTESLVDVSDYGRNGYKDISDITEDDNNVSNADKIIEPQDIYSELGEKNDNGQFETSYNGITNLNVENQNDISVDTEEIVSDPPRDSYDNQFQVTIETNSDNDGESEQSYAAAENLDQANSSTNTPQGVGAELSQTPEDILQQEIKEPVYK